MGQHVSTHSHYWLAHVHIRAIAPKEFEAFYQRKDTFSLGICNGCQLMALLGVVPFSKFERDQTQRPDEEEAWFQSQPRFIHNESGRFESRFVTLKIMEGNPSIFLKGRTSTTILHSKRWT
jgi:phosphoribosylformylglycinamidine synthase